MLQRHQFQFSWALSLSLSLSLGISPTFAQKKKLTLEESLTNPTFGMAVRQLHGFEDGSYGEVVSAGKKGEALIKVSKTKSDTLFFATDWKSDKKSFGRINWKSATEIYSLWGPELWTYDLKTKKANKVSTLVDEAENQDLEGNGLAIAYTIENNLYIQKGDQTLPVTRETDKNIVCGSSGVHRNEYGISKGTFWSPKGSALAFYRMDQGMVTDYPLVELNAKPAKVRNIKYPMAGQTSHEVKVGVFHLASGQTVFLKVEGPKDQYLTGITWSPDEKYITITILNRETNHFKLNVYDAQTGNFVKTLLEEKSEKYLDPQEGPLFVNDGLDFVWQSERNGFNHLYLFDWAGKFKRQLSEGNEEVKSIVGLDDKKQNLIYVQCGALGLDRLVKSVNLKSGKPTILSQVRGVHNPIWCDGKKSILDVWSNVENPKNIDLVDLGSRKISNLKTWKDKNPWTTFEVGKIDTFSIKGKSGERLQCRMIKPSNFDPAKKYPVIVYLYGGPHAQMITNSWMAGASPYFMAWAEEGFLVFTLDNRGSDGRGEQFEKAHHRQMGTPEMEDQLSGVEYLRSLSYVDGTRLGIHGWSYGGFMTTTLMTRAAGTYKVGIAGAPVIDWALYEIMYGERYMDTPKENPEGFETSNLANHASKLKGKFMLIHGTSDEVVVWQHTQTFLKAAIEAGVQPDYFIYPGHGHGIGGKDRLHLMRKMTNYFKDNL